MALSPHRDPHRLRSVERLVARHLRQGGRAELARARLKRAEILLELGEDLEGSAALEELVGQLEADLAGDDGSPALREELRSLLVRTFARRIELKQQDGDGVEGALADIGRALQALEALRAELIEPELSEEDEPPRQLADDLADEPAPGPADGLADGPLGERRVRQRRRDLAEIEAELWIQLGRLLVVTGQAESGEEALRRAVVLSGRLESPRARGFLLRARRELATALAQTDVDAGLEELNRAEREVDGELLGLERDLLRSSRAELLANAGKFEEALALLTEGWEGEPPEWALVQQAATCELAGSSSQALEAGARVIERRGRGLDPRDRAACHALAEALLSQARRTGTDEERAAYALRALRILEDFPHLPTRSLRLVASAQELIAVVAGDPAEARAILAARVALLEGLARDTGGERDRIELTRAYLQLGDALLRLDEPREARRAYGWGVAELRRWPSEHPFVVDVLPQALHALGQALAAQDLWLAARRQLDEAAALIEGRSDPDALADLAHVLLFRAVTHLSTGDARNADRCLEADTTRLLTAAVRDEGPLPGDLVEALISLYVLQAEVAMDHLEEPDRALACYDQALELRELQGDVPGVARAAILGAKGAVLYDAGRSAEAVPLLRECLALFADGGLEDDEDRGDLALARVNLAGALAGSGNPREALVEIGEASKLLDDVNGAADEARMRAIAVQLYQRRGEALRDVGHPLLAVDELTRAVDLCRALLDDDEDEDEDEDEAYHEARLRLPLVLLRRARCWLDAQEPERAAAAADLREARRLYAELVRAEARPDHRRRLREVKDLLGDLDDEPALADDA